jgi:hypothetical protein
MTNEAGTPSKTAGRRPLCAAPFNSLLVDPDKGVRPCCRYFPPIGHHVPGSVSIGKLDATTSLAAIRDSAAWRDVADRLAAGDTPVGCHDCLQRERETGYSGRGDYDDPEWDKGLRYLEINTSNICTLQCRHCDGHFSHRWARVQGMPTHKADTTNLLENLRATDLSRLEVVAFKGGEPLVNPDLGATLEHLAAIGRLASLEVRITTNGTVDPAPFLPLLRRARRCWFNLSVDGVGAVQTYIRHGRSDVENVQRLVAACSAIPDVRYGLITSVMAYNVHQLPAIAAWWRKLAGAELRSKWVRRWRRWTRQAEFLPLSFFNIVTSPGHLALGALQDATRARLADRYEQLDATIYGNVVRVLRQPFAGARAHDQLVLETLRTDRLLGRSWRDAVPELADELVLLDRDASLAEFARRPDVSTTDMAAITQAADDLAAAASR